jgi:hypothetical protein
MDWATLGFLDRYMNGKHLIGGGGGGGGGIIPIYIISIRERLEYRPFGDLRSLQKAASTKSFFFSFPPQFCDVGNQVGNHP